MGILHSKLIQPGISQTVGRERLRPLLDVLGTKRLTKVVAGAGYGKTTLIAQAVACAPIKTVWYRLDETDTDFVAVLSYLIAGLQTYFPDIGAATYLHISMAQALAREREAILLTFLSEIEHRLREDLIIVLDDYHLINANQEINLSLQFLMDRFSPLVHLVIISRTQPKIKFSRLRAAGDLLEINERHLAFVPDEIESLYKELYGLALDQGKTSLLARKTGGWVAGLILLYHSVQERPHAEIDGIFKNIKGSQRLFAAYLEENVYALLDDRTRAFLCRTSLLSRISADFANQLLHIDNAQAILEDLYERHLFTFPLDEDGHWYTYHHLFQQFLQDKFRSYGQDAVAQQHQEAAQLWEQYGEEEEALRHYFAGKQVSAACGLLSRMGRRKLLKQGRLQLIDSYLKQIPPELIEHDPSIQYIQARVLELSGRAPAAVKAYTKAYEGFPERPGLQLFSDRRFQTIPGNVQTASTGSTVFSKTVLRYPRVPHLRRFAPWPHG